MRCLDGVGSSHEDLGGWLAAARSSGVPAEWPALDHRPEALHQRIARIGWHRGEVRAVASNIATSQAVAALITALRHRTEPSTAGHPGAAGEPGGGRCPFAVSWTADVESSTPAR